MYKAACLLIDVTAGRIMQFARALFVLGTIVAGAFAARAAESHNDSCDKLIVPKTVVAYESFQIIFKACRKHAHYQLENLAITLPTGSGTTIPLSLLFVKDITLPGKYIVFTRYVDPLLAGLPVRYTLNYKYSKHGSQFEPGTVSGEVMVSTVGEGYPALTLQPFHCGVHKYHVGDAVRLYVLIYHSSYYGLSFSDIVLYAIKDSDRHCQQDSSDSSSSPEKKKCRHKGEKHGDKKESKEAIASLDGFDLGTRAPYQVADWVIPCKFKHSCVRVVLQYTITSSTYGSFQQREYLMFKVE